MDMSRSIALRCRTVAAVGLLALGACTSNPASSLPPLESAAPAPYTLEPGDQLRVVVFGQEELPTEYTIDDEGRISMPLIGAVEAEGLTPSELEAQLAQQFTRVLVDPSVSVQALAARPVYVVGAVNEPGAYPYTKGMTVISAVAMANGFLPYAYQDYYQITRTDMSGVQKDYSATGKDLVQADDIVFVYEQFKDY